ncbi:hypothetical protein [Marinobacter xestospongiae]|uniref:Uncharacterized protein n=1 Tax=Marinobacter xestospongiae TaxID=994319 RepID=A0ABU3W4C6_9GAMM|nr:hypothetical protein [Marinobacter xestospongiae]MDV2080856.1 hypothetical protein [Marinobacter xestospongiae]
MFGFGSRSLVGDTELEWQLDTYGWLLRNFGRRFRDVTYILVKPDRQHFPDECESEDEVFEKTFLRVKRYADMEHWPCELLPQENDPETVLGDTLLIQGAETGPAGTFRYRSGGKGLVTYNRSLVSEPQALVSTYAHELGHYLTANCKEPPPGGWELWEPATDLTAVYMGFGLFMANSSFIFRQFSSAGTQGWRTQTLGYLSQPELLNALAIFMVLKSIDIQEVSPFLKRGLKGDLAKCLKFLKKTDVVSKLGIRKPVAHLRVVK